MISEMWNRIEISKSNRNCIEIVPYHFFAVSYRNRIEIHVEPNRNPPDNRDSTGAGQLAGYQWLARWLDGELSRIEIESKSLA